MELASLRAGERWSDHPASVHPVLAAASRAINDRVGDGVRAELGRLVPEMIGTASEDPTVSARLVLRCTDAAIETATLMRAELESARRTAQQVLDYRTGDTPSKRSSWLIWLTISLLDRVGLLTKVYRYDAALQVSLTVALIAGTSRDSDRKLVALLEACVAEARQAGRGSARSDVTEPSAALARPGRLAWFETDEYSARSRQDRGVTTV